MYRKSVQGWKKHIDFMALDLACMHISFFMAYTIRHGMVNPYANDAYIGLLICMTLMNIIVAVAMNTFKNVLKRGLYLEMIASVKHDMLVVGSAFCYLFAVKSGAQVSRIVMVLMGGIYLTISYISRLLWKRYLRRKLREEGRRSLLVITTSDKVEQVINHLKHRSFEADQVTGLILLDETAQGTESAGIPVVTNIKDAAEYICRKWVDEILLYIPKLELFPVKLMEQLQEMGMTVHVYIPDFFNAQGKKQYIESWGGMTVLTISQRFVESSQMFRKRCMDIVIGSIGCLITLFLAIIFGPIIHISSPGPIFFKQTRVGKNGKLFQMYKFRSMYPDAEARKAELLERNNVKDGMMFKMEHDPRIIGCRQLPDGTFKKGIGNFIREWSIDEFPQFYNVLKGDMSVVGTRPPTVDEWEKYSPHHRQRLVIKPGLTGLWQVSGRSSITDFEEVVKLDAKYIDEWSMVGDLKILVETVKVVLWRRGAK